MMPGLTAPSVGRWSEKEGIGMNTLFEFAHPYEFKLRPDWPVDIGIAGGCILGYVFAWIGLVSYFHTNHWIAGVIGALTGSFVGWIWFQLVMKNGSKTNFARD